MVQLRDALKGKLRAKELALVPRAFDLVGDLAIFSELPEELVSREKLIAKTLLTLHPHLRVVLKKVGRYGGKYRTPKLKILAGERRKETLHTENGCRFKLHPEKAYFSARSATERKRIFSLIAEGERVLVMFSGIGVYPITIAKHAEPKEVVGVELNPAAHTYAIENLVLNRLEQVELLKGDVRQVVPRLSGTFDRIVMPLPLNAPEFLDVALKKSRKGTTVHLYAFGSDSGSEAKEKIKAACGLARKRYRILRVVPCGSYGPGISRLCVDFRIV